MCGFGDFSFFGFENFNMEDFMMLGFGDFFNFDSLMCEFYQLQFYELLEGEQEGQLGKKCKIFKL